MVQQEVCMIINHDSIDENSFLWCSQIAIFLNICTDFSCFSYLVLFKSCNKFFGLDHVRLARHSSAHRLNSELPHPQQAQNVDARSGIEKSHAKVVISVVGGHRCGRNGTARWRR